MGSVAEADYVSVGLGEDDQSAFIGHNFKANLEELKKRMFQAAADLEFEEAARLRDEIKRLEDTELLVASDPMTRLSVGENPKPGRPGNQRPSGRSTAGKPGTRSVKGKSRTKMY